MTAVSGKIRVAHVITGLGVGGAEMMLVKLLTKTNRDRFEPVVISLSADLALAERIRESAVQVLTAEMKPSLIGGLRAAPRLRATLSALGVDLVQTWMYHADLAGGLTARTLRLPVIWNIQAGTLDAEGMILRTRVLARAAGALSHVIPERIVSCSHAAVDVHESIGYRRSKFVVIPNGTNVDQFRPDAEMRAGFRAELDIPAGATLVGMVARLHPQKDHATLFSAIANLVRTHPHVRLVLCGLGLEHSNAVVTSMLAAAGIDRHTILLGLRPDVSRVLAGLDVHVLSSSFGEAFPNVLGEAMAAGAPCVVTDVGDSALIVGNTGFSVPRRKPAALADALRQMLDMPTADFEDLRVRARDRIVSEFSLQKSITAYEALYEDIVRARRRIADRSSSRAADSGLR